MKIAFVGDVMLGRLVNESLQHKSPDYPWGNTLSLLQDADVRICNLECVLSDIGKPWSLTPKVFHFRSDEKNVKTLQAADIHLVSIANNHVLDFEYEAMKRMIDILDQNGIKHAGAGMNLKEAAKPACLQVNNLRIAMIALTDNEPMWAASENKPGIFYIPMDVDDNRMLQLLEHMAHVKKEVDLLVISLHWGPNWSYYPSEEHIKVAHAMIDVGADVIFGHSPHIFRGIEIYKNRPIIYSAGDFIDDYAVDEVERNDESFIFVLEIGHNFSLKLHLYPTCIGKFQAIRAPDSRQKAILTHMEKLCQDFGSNLLCFSNYATLEIA